MNFKKTLSLGAVILFSVLLLSVSNKANAQLADNSVSINSATVDFSDPSGDANSNGIVNGGDQITINAYVKNTDGGCAAASTTVFANLVSYGGTGAEQLNCITDNGGSPEDFFQLVFDVVATSSGSGISYNALDPNAAITVTAYDSDDIAGTSTDVLINHAVDTHIPTLETAYFIGGNVIQFGFSEPVYVGDSSDFANLNISGEEGYRTVTNVDYGTNHNTVYVYFDGPRVPVGATGTTDINDELGSITDNGGNALDPIFGKVISDNQIEQSAVTVNGDWTDWSDAHDDGFTLGVDGFNNLQNALDSVATSGVVYMATGTTYSGSDTISITRPLSLLGPGINVASTTIINTDCNYVLSVESSGVTIQGLSIEQDDGVDQYCQDYPSIRIVGADINTTGVNIIGNDISGGNRGLQIRNDVSSTTVSHNIFHDNSDGLAISGSVGNTVTNNEFLNNRYGIDFRPGSENTYIMDGNIVDNNNIHNNSDAGIYIDSGMFASDTPVIISNNTIDSNNCDGIYINDSVSGLNIVKNTITGNGCFSAVRTYSIDNIHINHNTISGNPDAGVDNQTESTSTLDAIANYWGDSSGPYNETTNASGTGDSVNDYVDYAPYYTDSDFTTLSTVASSSLLSLFMGGTFTVSTSTTQVTVNGTTTLNVSTTGGTNTVTLPNGLVITKTLGGTFTENDLTMSQIALNALSGLGSGTVVDGALQFGIPNIGLTFNPAITISIYVGTSHNGQQLDVKHSTSETSGWTTDGITDSPCTVSSGYCTFHTTKASYFAAVTPAPVVTSSGGGGGAGAVILPSVSLGDISATQGGNGVYTSSNGFKVLVSVPVGAVSGPSKISIAPVIGGGSYIPSPASGLLMVGNSVYDITLISSPAVSTFSKPITITFSYPATQFTGVDESSLKIYYFDTTLNSWIAIPSTIDMVNKTVTVTVNHLTKFALLAKTNSAGVAVTANQQISSSTSVLSFIFGKDLKQGMKDSDVVNLQNLLKSKGYFSDDATGYFGAVTLKAVMAYQKDSGLPSTGYVGSMTRGILNKVSAMVPAALSSQTTTSVTSSNSFNSDLKIGMKNDDVTRLQNFLKQKGYFNTDATGYFGSVTQSALIQFQKAMNINPAAGYFGPITRAKLNTQ